MGNLLSKDGSDGSEGSEGKEGSNDRIAVPEVNNYIERSIKDWNNIPKSELTPMQIFAF